MLFSPRHSQLTHKKKDGGLRTVVGLRGRDRGGGAVSFYEACGRLRFSEQQLIFLGRPISPWSAVRMSTRGKSTHGKFELGTSYLIGH